MNSRRRLVPETLFGQITLIIILGLACSQLVGFALSMREYQRGGSEFFNSVMLERVGSYTALFDSLRPQDRESIAAALSRQSFQLGVAADKAIAPELKEDVQSLRADLAARAGVEHEIVVSASTDLINAEMQQRADRGAFMSRRDSPDGKIRPPHDDGFWTGWLPVAHWLRFSPRLEPDPAGRRPPRDPALTPLIQVRLSDGTWLRFLSHAPARVFSLSPFLVFNWILLLAAALAVSVFAARLATRPFKRLADAAEGLSRDLNARPLEEKGPVEAREAARAFNRMHDRLAGYLNSRSRMLMAMSHDLKTPLTRLRLRSELLEEGEVSERIKADLDEMEALVMTTLEYLRGSETREEVMVVEARALVSAICEDHPVWCDAIKVEDGPAIPLPARPVMLRRALSNILDNAVRYGGGSGQRVEVSVSAPAAGGEALISIRDFGPGVAEDQMENVFKPFVRLEESRNRATGGSGLGLAIAREIVEAHGGRIELSNRQPGLEVRVLLPLPPPR